MQHFSEFADRVVAETAPSLVGLSPAAKCSAVTLVAAKTMIVVSRMNDASDDEVEKVVGQMITRIFQRVAEIETATRH